MLARSVWLVLAAIVSVQLGAGVAKSIFDEVSPTALLWLRLASSALILVAFVRPRLSGRSRADWYVVLAFGASLGLMNWSFYQAFARIPLGIAVTIEFIGPLAVALFTSRRARDLIWVALAAVGVALLGVERASLDLVGVLFALVAGGCWAAYILLSAQTGARWPKLDGLSTASVIAALVITPLLIPLASVDRLMDPRVLLVGVVVGLLSSVLPYSFELTALRAMKAQTFAILLSLEPAAAALVGLLVVGEVLSFSQMAAIACVVVASAGATRAAAVHSTDTTARTAAVGEP